jgi:glycosyltransferase involved in cell wall biosynthesis
VKTRYILVSPVRDEQEYIEKTIRSVISQTLVPMAWIFVNDGSTDRTREIIETYIRNYPWIQVIDREDRGFRMPGKGIVEAFYEGFERVKELPWDFVVKLDCDLSFEPNYFENILREFDKCPQLGIASGKTFLPVKGNANHLKLEWCPDTCTRGPAKMYKRECFENIGGIRREFGWDTMDDIAAMVEGYVVRSFSQYALIHYRPIGMRTHCHQGLSRSLSLGPHLYYLGYHPLFVILKSIKMMWTDRPFFWAGIGVMLSYGLAIIRRSRRIDDSRLIKKLQEVQLKRIFKARN